MWYYLGVHIVFGLPMWILMLTANCYTCYNCSWLCLNHINCDCVWIDWFVMSWLLIELFGPGAVLDWMGLRPWLVYWVLVLYKVSDRFSIDLMNLCLERDDHLYRVGNCFHGCGLEKYEKSKSYSIDLIEPMFGTCWSFIMSRKNFSDIFK